MCDCGKVRMDEMREVGGRNVWIFYVVRRVQADV